MKKINLLFLIFFHNASYGQNNIYITLETGLGSTFVKINHKGHAYNNLNNILIPSFDLGINVRIEFNERFSGNIGICNINYGYGTKFKFNYPDHAEQTIKNNQSERFLSFPVSFRTLFNIHNNRKIYFAITGGGAFGIRVGDLVNGFASFIPASHAPNDSITAAILFFQQTNPFSLNLFAGIGLEKKLKKGNRLGFDIIYRPGILKAYEGRVETLIYSQPVSHPIGSAIPPYSDPVSITDFFSRNHSLFITFFYAINLKKKNKLYFIKAAKHFNY